MILDLKRWSHSAEGSNDGGMVSPTGAYAETIDDQGLLVRQTGGLQVTVEPFRSREGIVRDSGGQLLVGVASADGLQGRPWPGLHFDAQGLDLIFVILRRAVRHENP